MAKKSKSTEPSSNGAQAPEGHTDLTIQGFTFRITAPYSEGHTCTDAEARTLNQTRAENIRNNAAKMVKKAKDEAAKSGGAVDLSALQAAISDYDSKYEFSGFRAARAPVDPIERIAHSIAREALKAAIRQKGIDLKTLPEGKLDDLVAEAVGKNPTFREQARARHEAAQAAAATALEGLDLAPSAA